MARMIGIEPILTKSKFVVLTVTPHSYLLFIALKFSYQSIKEL